MKKKVCHDEIWYVIPLLIVIAKILQNDLNN